MSPHVVIVWYSPLTWNRRSELSTLANRDDIDASRHVLIHVSRAPGTTIISSTLLRIAMVPLESLDRCLLALGVGAVIHVISARTEDEPVDNATDAPGD